MKFFIKQQTCTATWEDPATTNTTNIHKVKCHLPTNHTNPFHEGHDNNGNLQRVEKQYFKTLTDRYPQQYYWRNQ